MKNFTEWIGWRASPDSIPFSQLPFKLQVTFVTVAGAVAVGLGKLLGL